MTFLFYIALMIFLSVSALLCLVILVQESKSMGLGAAFGGDPSNSLFGTSTAQVLKKFTAYLAGIFMLSCILLSFWSSRIASQNRLFVPTIEQQEETPAQE
jgi:preprotein translocase subunit SecG